MRGGRTVKRFLRVLRSPRLALWLVLAVTAYSLLATFIPQSGLADPGTMTWMAEHPWWTSVLQPLGLFAAFNTPVFSILILLLTASTAACAWERTRLSLRLWNSHSTVTDSLVRRLQDRPQLVFAGDAGSLDRCAAALRDVGLRVRRGPRLVVGESGRFGLLGSPVFHWALVAFFIVVSAGQLTRSEGQMGIPVGASRREVAESYGTLSSGRLFKGHSGLTLSVPRIEKHNVVNGIDREPAPQVVLSDGRRVLRDQLVYPNRPLRYGAFIVHRGPFGFALPVSVESTTGQVVGSLDLLVDVEENSPIGTAPAVVHLKGPDRSIDVTLTLVPVRGPRGAVILQPQLRTQVRVQTFGTSAPSTVTAPGVVALPDGLVLKLGAVKNYARIGVVYDWSVWWIYALLGVATIGLCVAMLAPRRVVRILLVDSEVGEELHAVVDHSRNDPLFAQRVQDALGAVLTANAVAE